MEINLPLSKFSESISMHLSWMHQFYERSCNRFINNDENVISKSICLMTEMITWFSLFGSEWICYVKQGGSHMHYYLKYERASAFKRAGNV